MGTRWIWIAVLGFWVVALLWPSWRTWRRHGVFAVVFHREAGAWQRAVGGALGLLMVLLQLWSALLAAERIDLVGLWPAPTWLAPLGWALAAAGTALVLWAQRSMGAAWRVGIDDRPTALVTAGPFRLCRNPIFTGMLAALAGLGMVAPGPWPLGLWLAAATAIGWQVRQEERHLLRLHGARYRSWATRVGRFVPGLGRLDGQAAT